MKRPVTTVFLASVCAGVLTLLVLAVKGCAWIGYALFDPASGVDAFGMGFSIVIGGGALLALGGLLGAVVWDLLSVAHEMLHDMLWGGDDGRE